MRFFRDLSVRAKLFAGVRGCAPSRGAGRELAEKSDQIGAIVQTITGIAEQTNLLALNAAIEAPARL